MGTFEGLAKELGLEFLFSLPQHWSLAQLQLSNEAGRVASLLEGRPKPSWLKPTSCPCASFVRRWFSRFLLTSTLFQLVQWRPPEGCCWSDQWSLGHRTRYIGTVGFCSERVWGGPPWDTPEWGTPGGLRTLSDPHVTRDCQRLRLVCEVGYAPVGVTPGVCFGGFLKSHYLPISLWEFFTLMWFSISWAARVALFWDVVSASWVQTGLSGTDWDIVGVKLEIVLSWPS